MSFYNFSVTYTSIIFVSVLISIFEGFCNSEVLLSFSNSISYPFLSYFIKEPVAASMPHPNKFPKLIMLTVLNSWLNPITLVSYPSYLISASFSDKLLRREVVQGVIQT